MEIRVCELSMSRDKQESENLISVMISCHDASCMSAPEYWRQVSLLDNHSFTLVELCRMIDAYDS